VYSQKPIMMRGTEPATSQFMVIEGTRDRERCREKRFYAGSILCEGGCTERRRGVRS
jgi:hypothetical protein